MSSTPGRQNAALVSDRESRGENQIDQSLKCTIRAFTTHWLSLVSQYRHLPIAELQDISRDSWRAARRNMLRTINRISYKSILSLYLFAQTPIPVGISADEELDGLSAQVCMQTALYQLQRLREQRAPSDSASLTAQYVDLESRVYWAAMTWDTSISLTSGTRTSLSSGLKGPCAEPTWRLVKAFLVGSFASRWQDSDLELTFDTAYEIIAAARIAKTYIWKNITSLREALREGVSDAGVLFAWEALVGAMEIYSTIVRPLIDRCERKMLFFDQRVRLNWYCFQVQYHLGILMLANALEVAGREDLRKKMEKAEQDAEHEACVVLKFGLENKYTVYESGVGGNNNPERGQPLLNASLVAIDPHPQYALDLVLLMRKRLDRRVRDEKITREIYASLDSILREVVEQLPRSSKVVQDARNGECAA